MTIEDHASVLALWRRTEGMGLGESDERDAIDRFLCRNPGMSAVAVAAEGALVGAVLCGHDGRRGYLHHLAVDASHRGRGIARALIVWCFAKLAAEKIPKCNVFLFIHNAAGRAFWEHDGWSYRGDLQVLQKWVATGG